MCVLAAYHTNDVSLPALVRRWSSQRAFGTGSGSLVFVRPHQAGLMQQLVYGLPRTYLLQAICRRTALSKSRPFLHPSRQPYARRLRLRKNGGSVVSRNAVRRARTLRFTPQGCHKSVPHTPQHILPGAPVTQKGGTPKSPAFERPDLLGSLLLPAQRTGGGSVLVYEGTIAGRADGSGGVVL